MAASRIVKRETKKGTRFHVKWREAGRVGSDRMKAFPTLAEAKKFQAELTLASEMSPRSEKTTLKDGYLRLIAAKKAAGRAKGTLDQLGWSMKHLGDIENLPLEALTVAYLNKHLEKLRAKGLSNGVIVKVQQLVSGIFDLAISEGVFHGDNPMNRAIKVKRKAPLKGPVMLPLKTVQALAAAIPERERAAFWMMAGMGLRIGEVEALKRSDFNADFSKVHITRTKKNRYEGPVKTARSNRVLDIPTHIQELLKKVVPHGTERRMFYVGQSWARHHLEPACEEVGIDRITCHDLRDVAAGTLLHSGLDLASVSKFLGHANTQVTASRYLAAMDDSAARAAEIMNRIHKAS